MDTGRAKKDVTTPFKIIDRQMPIANIANIMKDAMPPNGKISKDAKELMGKCASEFIAIITCRANDICECEARKTITGEDLIRAMEDLDLTYYSEIMKVYLDKFKETSNGDLKLGKYMPFGYQEGKNINFHNFTE
jgi:nuclear transcription Y subunit beta